MAEARRGAGQRLEDLDLHGRVGDVVFAADDMGDAKVDVVDHRGQRIEVAPVLAPQHRIGERGAVDMTLAAHHVVPPHGRRLEAKAPVRLAAVSLERRALGVGQAQRGAVIDRRTAERLLALAPPVEFFGRLVGGIEPARALSSPPRRRRAPSAPTAAHEVGRDASQARSFSIASAYSARSVRGRCRQSAERSGRRAPDVEPVEQGGAGVADMDAPGRRGREADNRA